MSYLLADGESDYYFYDGGVIVGGGAFGSGGPPTTKAKYKEYYKRHKLGPETEAAIEKAFQKRLKGEWVAVGRRASKHGKHRPVRKAGSKKKVAKKKVSSLAAKKKAYFKKYREEHDGSRKGALAKWRKLHPEDKPKKRKRTTKK